MKSGIHEKTFIEINGFRHGMFIKGSHSHAPILLFLHGGPGFPMYGLTQKYPTYLEENFIVCWWEQRGAGLSYNKNIKPEQITVENIISDTIEITNYLCKRFNKEKIYLMGHSWGSFIGLLTAKKKPELYHAYIGVAQITDQLESEKLAYKYMLGHYKKENNKPMIQKLEKLNVSEFNSIPLEYIAFRDKPMHELGIGTMRNMKSVITGIFLPIMKNKEYTFSERVTIWKAKSFCLKKTGLWDAMTKTNMYEKIKSLHLPIYFFHGLYDYTVNYELAKNYYMQLQAPMKGFYTFINSAHSPIFEEPERLNKILMEDVMNLTLGNSDKNAAAPPSLKPGIRKNIPTY